MILPYRNNLLNCLFYLLLFFSTQEAMRKMTEEDKQKIALQVELFRKEKMTFDSEVGKWDDTGNDIIFLAKHMCIIMMEMTDFTR